jgi:glucose-1-phosphate thymidylyltransferase
MPKYFGLIPAAGLATRMRPFRYPKELLPVYYEFVDEGTHIRPKLLIENCLESLAMAGVHNTYIIVPDWKPEIMRYLEDGKLFNHHIAYLYNSKALGLADALLSGYEWLHDKHVCFAMPDTVFSPVDTFQKLINELERTSADLVLGVFPIDQPQHFAPVEFNSEGEVLSIEDKPLVPKFKNTWGTAVWSPAFWQFFNNHAKTLEPGVSISDTFDKAAKNGLKVQCVYFADGWYKDIGRINDIKAKG